MPGRRPKPTAQKRLEGNPGKRKLNDREPQYSSAAPKMPGDILLDALERRIWRDELPRLLASKVLTEADGHVLARFCVLKARLVRNRRQQKKFGWPQTCVDANGVPKKHPLILVEDGTLKELRQVEGELGMTPASRSRIQIPAPDDDDELDEFDAPATGTGGKVTTFVARPRN